MIGLQGVRSTIEDVRQHGSSMEDLYDLEMLYRLEEYMMRKKHAEENNGISELTLAGAQQWVAMLQNEDPTKPTGGKWTIEQVKPFAQKRGMPAEGDEAAAFYAAMNAMYSDYYAIAKKYNVLVPDFFADLAMAFINDKDAVENKTAIYYECIVKK